MNIQLVSYLENLSPSIKTQLTAEIYNRSNADLILYPGHTLDTSRDVAKLATKLDSRNSTALFEVKGISNWMENCLFRIRKGQIENCYTRQLFSESKEVNNNPLCLKELLYELEKNRLLKVKGNKIRTLMCGELNLLRNYQNDNNRVDFRVDDHKLKTTFEEILADTHIMLNPMHTPMGNQGKMAKRREYLSQNGRAYFSTCNLPQETENPIQAFANNKLQYAYLDGNELEGEIINCNEKYLVKEYLL
ncbi:hypothetical protein ACXR6G_18225 [Ancylomarina sp. YFZ004]